MDYSTIKLRVAENIGSLDTDGSTIIDGKVTQTGIKNKINDLHREELAPLFSDKFTHNYKRTTYPFNTNIGTGTVDATSTSTTLVATTSIFSNHMEGLTVENTTDSETRTLKTYSSGTQFTVDTAIDDDWDGDTIYILGDTYTFGGNTDDLKEVIKVEIKYASTDSKFTDVDQIDMDDLTNNESFSKASPKFSLTSLVELDGSNNEIRRPAVKIFPAPDSYLGKLKITYVEIPRTMTNDTDLPVLAAQGSGEILVNGVTAWAFRLQDKFEEAREYDRLYQMGKRELIMNYKPKTRSGARVLRLNAFHLAQRRGEV